MVLRATGPLAVGARPLALENVPEPALATHDLLVEVSVCGVCHTELDEIEGRMAPRRLPVILGHQVVGRVIGRGSAATGALGTRVGIPWIHGACGRCAQCLAGRENLCPFFVATGRDVDGGYAEYVVVPEAFAHPLPDALADVTAAPLLCAGAIGYRSLRLTGIGDGQRLGLTGFGASGHLVLGLARHLFPRSDVFVFARSDEDRAFARDLGATWTGATNDDPGVALDAVIDTTPAWTPVVRALERLAPAGRLVINAIRKESTDRDVLREVDYARHLWLEKEIKSVANVTRADVREFLALAAAAGIAPQVQERPLDAANEALRDLKHGVGRGAKVLRVR
jgi:propanol-preferring alcohol dehydrogenase